MGWFHTEGIVLDSLKLGEKDKMVLLYTLDRGAVRAVAKGARAFHSRFGASLEPLTHGRYHLFEKEGRELVRVDRAEILYPYPHLRSSLEALEAAGRMLGALRRVAPREEAHPAVFHLLQACLGLLEIPFRAGEGRFPGLWGWTVVLYFQFHLLCQSGFRPDLEHCLQCEQAHTGTGMVFLPARGRGLCPRCASRELEGGISLGGEAWAFLSRMARIPPDRLERFRVSPEALREIQSLIQAALAWSVGIPSREADPAGVVS